jgi:hypothetical protein
MSLSTLTSSWYPSPNALGRLYCYRATREAALLFPGAPCCKDKINFTPTSLAFWEEIKLHHVRNGGSFENLCLVTEAYSTSTWALDYRFASHYDDCYAVNVQNTGVEELPGNFDMRHTSLTLRDSSRQPDSWPQYTILETHIPASRTRLCGQRWPIAIFR